MQVFLPSLFYATMLTLT